MSLLLSWSAAEVLVPAAPSGLATGAAVVVIVCVGAAGAGFAGAEAAALAASLFGATSEDFG